MPSVRIIGGGRAGGSVHGALVAAGWTSAGVLGRHDDPTGAARDVDLLVLATPDERVTYEALVLEAERLARGHAT